MPHMSNLPWFAMFFMAYFMLFMTIFSLYTQKNLKFNMTKKIKMNKKNMYLW